jgi:hypothetical protein
MGSLASEGIKTQPTGLELRNHFACNVGFAFPFAYVRHAPCSMLHAPCSVLCTLYSVLCTLYSVLCTLCSVLCALCSVLCALCSVLCALCLCLCLCLCLQPVELANDGWQAHDDAAPSAENGVSYGSSDPATRQRIEFNPGGGDPKTVNSCRFLIFRSLNACAERKDLAKCAKQKAHSPK